MATKRSSAVTKARTKPKNDGMPVVKAYPKCSECGAAYVLRMCFHQIAAALGLYTTNPGSFPATEALTDVIGYVQNTGRRTDVPEGG